MPSSTSAGCGRATRWPPWTRIFTTISSSPGPTVHRTASGERRIKWPSTKLTRRPAFPTPRVDIIFVHGHGAVLPLACLHGRTAGPRRGAGRGLRHPGRRAAGRRPAPPAHPGDRDHATTTRCGAAGHWRPASTRAPSGSSACSPRWPAGRASRPCPLWAAVPHYVAQAPSPKAELALLHRIEELLQVPLDSARTQRGGRSLGARRGRAGHRGPRESPPMCASWRRPRTPPTCRRPAASPSPANSSATSRDAARTSRSTAPAGRTQLRRSRRRCAS